MYKDHSKAAAIVCEHVANGNASISYAEKSKPLDDADSGWQFLCGLDDEDSEKAEVWAIGEVLQKEPSLSQFIDAPTGTVLIRNSIQEPWQVVK
jgi:hypothetical protein